MRVQDLMDIPIFKEAHVVAGQSGIVRPVQSINMMDAPDIVEFLKPNELLITTAYALKDDVLALESLVRAMANQGCAGLGIKTRRFLADIPGSLVRLADEYQFPLIELPLGPSLGEMLTQALSFILERRTEELQYSLTAHQEFSELILRGKGIKDLINSLVDIVRQPIAVFEQNGDQLCCAGVRTDSEWDDIMPQISFIIPSLVTTGMEPISMSIIRPGVHVRSGIEITLIPIHPTQRFGFICVTASVLSLEKFTLLALEQAGNVIGFEMMKLKAVKERARRYKNDFFSDLMDGLIVSERELLTRGKSYGVQMAPKFQVLVIKVDPSEPRNSYSRSRINVAAEAERDWIYETVQLDLGQRGVEYSLFSKNHALVVIIYGLWAESLAYIHPDLLSLCEQLREVVQQRTTVSVSIGLGNAVTNLLDIPKSYTEALEAMESGYRTHRHGFVSAYRTKDITDLLRLIPDGDLSQYRDNALGQLLDLPDSEQGILLDTLSTFLDHRGNVAESAKALYIHRNTILYRLNKCEQLLGMNLKHTETFLRLRLGILIHDLLSHSHAPSRMDQKQTSHVPKR